MEEDTELEEGEACYSKDDDNIDLDALSYIDERIQHVLGHFQKDFEGGVSAEKLGAKFGGYGSFLPTYERPYIPSHSKTLQRNFSSPKSPKNPHMEAVSDNPKSPSDIPPSMSLGTASGGFQSFQTLKAPAFDYSMKKGVGISSNAKPGRCLLKDDSTNRLGNSTDQRTLKFRIKMKSNMSAQKNAVIYSGLGLDNSPSSSMGNSPEENEGRPTLSQKTAEESPTSIIQVMSSFPIPGGVLLSPLHDSLLYLMRKEKVLGDRRSRSSLNGSQEHCSVSTDESDSFMGDGQLLKTRKVRIVGQSKRQLELKHKNGNGFDKETTLHTTKKLENRTPDHKDFLSNDLKCTPLSSLICDAGEPAEVTGKASEVSMEINEDAVKGGAVMEESLESISGQDFDTSEKQHAGNGFIEKVSEHELANILGNNPTDPKINGKCKVNMISKKTKCDAIKFKVHQDHHKHQTNQKGKPLSEDKNNSKGDSSPSKAVAVRGKDSSGAGNYAVITDKKNAASGVTSLKSQMHKTKSLKDNKVRDSNRESMKEKKLEPPGHRAITDVNLDNDEERSAYRIKVKERPSGNKVGDQLIARPCIKDALKAWSVAENKLTPGIVPAAAPQVIAEHWVCCDSCQKWRLLPLGIKPEQLPEKWLCSMLNWLPGMNRCDINEEVTTKAVYALNQMPISEGQNDMQSQATGMAVGMSSADALHLGQNNRKISSDVMSGQGKKKYNFKEKTKAGISGDVYLFTKSSETNALESGKNRGITDINQQPDNSNPVRKSSYQHLIRLNNLKEEKHIPKEKTKELNRGDRKHIKLKHKMEADQNRSGTPKKSKTEDANCTNSQLNSDMDLDQVGLNSRNCSPTKTSGKDMWKYDEYCLSEDVKDKLVVPVKKLRDHVQVLSNGAPLGATNSSKKDVLMKIGKLKDWMDNKKQNNALFLQDGEEGSLSGFRKEKKFKVLKILTNSRTEGDIEFNRKDGMKPINLSDSRDNVAIGTEEVRSIDKAQQQRKNRKKVTSQQALNGNDPLGRNLDSGQHSLAATSSSSMISGFHKARTNFEDVRVSPVESITSSPLRTSNLDKLILTEGDTSGMDAAAKGVLPSMSSKRCLDNKEEKQSTKRKKRVLNDSRPERLKISSTEFQVEDSEAKVIAKTSSVSNDHLLSGGVRIIKHDNCANGTLCEDRENMNNQKRAFSWQESGKVTSLWVEEKVRRSASEVDSDKMKASASENGYSKIGRRHESAVDLTYHESGHKARNGPKYNSPKSKTWIDNISMKDSVISCVSESGKKIELKSNDVENFILKVDIPCSTKRNILSQQNLIEDFKEENRADHECKEPRDGKLEKLSLSDNQVQRETVFVTSITGPGSQKGDMSNGHPFHASGNGNLAKSVKSSADANHKVGVTLNSGNFAPDQLLNSSSPLRANSSQIASLTLHEAAKLKDTADNYKNSGFEFESNETYFEAALKFLHGASLLENCQSQSSKHGEMSQMQIYATTAKLFKSCAHEYERRQEMASAALAYKCMEVAYMQVVYCKHSGSNRLWHELQSTLHMVPQGESPSSSASDVDNLINQAAVDKATLPRGNSAHVAGNQVISVRNRPTFLWLLDFTQDVNFAMEASRKCQSTFAAACVFLGEARNKECIASVRRVIDFSFQDVDELLRLVWAATKAISRAGLDGVRD